MENNLIEINKNMDVIKTDTGDIKLTNNLVKNFLVRGNGNVTDQEVMLFIALCKHQKLNPWINEAYLIKYMGNQPATMIISKDVFTKRAFKNKNCDGWKAGITIYNKDTSEIIDREGSAYYKEKEVIVGGWCEVWFKDKTMSLKQSVEINEYIARKKDGTINKMWTEKPATMIRKVAIVQTLREAFPDDFQGCYIAEEMKTDMEELKILDVNANVTKEEVINIEDTKILQQSSIKIGDKQIKILADKIFESGKSVESIERIINKNFGIDKLDQLNMIQFQNLCCSLDLIIKNKLEKAV